jgi:hypothetical protein
MMRQAGVKVRNIAHNDPVVLRREFFGPFDKITPAIIAPKNLYSIGIYLKSVGKNSSIS